MVLLFRDSSSAPASSAAFVCIEESRYTIIFAATGGREKVSLRESVFLIILHFKINPSQKCFCSVKLVHKPLKACSRGKSLFWVSC